LKSLTERDIIRAKKNKDLIEKELMHELI
jgi:hypothetical protein